MGTMIVHWVGNTFVRLSIALVCLLALAAHPYTARAASNYYVATNGNDANLGTLSAPYRTIQKCASVAQAGDTCFIRAGTYHETITPANSGTAGAPITFQPYNGESVTVSGADVVTGWTQYNGNIYRANQTWDLGNGKNQVFVDGQMMIEGRWPNSSLDVSFPTAAIVNAAAIAGTAATVNDSALTQPNGYWNGATINMIVGYGHWINQTETVTSSSPGSLSISWLNGYPGDGGDGVQAGNRYYLTNTLAALDSASEWFHDSETDQLYLWLPANNNPNNHIIEVKRRQYTFNLRSRTYISLLNLTTFAGSIVTDDTSSNIMLDSLKASYVSHDMYSTGDIWSAHLRDSGIILYGSDNTLQNSEIAYSANNGVVIKGNNHRIINNLIHDVAYSGANNFGIATADVSNNVDISYNTIHTSGRGLLHHDGLRGSKIHHNDLSLGGIQTDDLGATYAFRSDGRLNGVYSEIAYNRIHDFPALDGRNVKAGVYLDGSDGYIVHHNVIWNIPEAIRSNDPGPSNRLLYNRIFNNTALAYNESLASTNTATWYDVQIANNIFNKSTVSGGVQQNNIYQGSNPQFVNPETNNYQLQANSPAIDAGRIASPYTDGYSGAAPDIGAYEYGSSVLSAGCDFDGCAPPIIIDSSVQETGQNQFNFAGNGWMHCTTCSSYYNNSVSYNATPNSSVSLAFNGTQVEVVAANWGVDGGISAISIDSGAETNVDFSAVTSWISPVLSAGLHTVTMRVTGTKCANCVEAYVPIDYVKIISPSSCTDTCTPSFYNDFEDGNTDGWTTNGGTWAVCQHGGSSKEYCQTANASYGDYRATTGSSSWSNYTVQASVSHGSGDVAIGLMVRVQDENRFYLLEVIAWDGVKTWKLQKMDNGTSTLLATGSLAYPGYAMLRIKASGSTLTAEISTDYVNYTTLGSATDNTWSTGKIGVRVAGNNPTGYFDTVRVTSL